MSLRKFVVAASLVVLTSAAMPSKASADWLFTPFIGGTFGGNAFVGGTGDDFKNTFERKLVYGASLGWMGAGIIGLEADFGYSPNFFRGDNNSDNINFIGDGNVTTLMGNLVVGAPLGAVRPYASGGVGLLKSSVDNAGQFLNVSRNDFGYDIGGGVMGFFGGNVGLRGDIRYFRSLQSNDPNGIDFSLGSFRFWRGTVGVTFKF
jgi:outer membrane protein with beta-barrel domain